MPCSVQSLETKVRSSATWIFRAGAGWDPPAAQRVGKPQGDVGERQLVLGHQAGLEARRDLPLMTNSERSSQLFAEAETILKEAERLQQEKNWNLCVRRCQEVVELGLKVMLIQMGKDYPRAHDVAPAVVEALRQRSWHLELNFPAGC